MAMLTHPLVKLVWKHVTKLIQCQQSLSIKPLEPLMLKDKLLKLPECFVWPRPIRNLGEAVHAKVYEDNVPRLQDIVSVVHGVGHTLGNISNGRDGW